MYTAMVVIQVIVSISLVALVLLQQGKGADAGAAFGAGASGTVFGSRGSANFLSRATAVCATLFMVISLALAYLVHDAATSSDSIVDRIGEEAPVLIPEPGLPEIPDGDSAPVTPEIPE
jgi:preprotein translocase subunit SecG